MLFLSEAIERATINKSLQRENNHTTETLTVRLTTSKDLAFDPLSESTIVHPGEAYRELAAKCPFHHYQGKDFSFFITSDYKEIRNEILSDNPVWSFKWDNAAKDWGTKQGEMNNVSFMTDPPFHLDWASL